MHHLLPSLPTVGQLWESFLSLFVLVFLFLSVARFFPYTVHCTPSTRHVRLGRFAASRPSIFHLRAHPACVSRRSPRQGTLPHLLPKDSNFIERNARVLTPMVAFQRSLLRRSRRLAPTIPGPMQLSTMRHLPAALLPTHIRPRANRSQVLHARAPHSDRFQRKMMMKKTRRSRCAPCRRTALMPKETRYARRRRGAKTSPAKRDVPPNDWRQIGRISKNDSFDSKRTRPDWNRASMKGRLAA